MESTSSANSETPGRIRGRAPPTARVRPARPPEKPRPADRQDRLGTMRDEAGIQGPDKAGLYSRVPSPVHRSSIPVLVAVTVNPGSPSDARMDMRPRRNVNHQQSHPGHRRTGAGQMQVRIFRMGNGATYGTESHEGNHSARGILWSPTPAPTAMHARNLAGNGLPRGVQVGPGPDPPRSGPSAESVGAARRISNQISRHCVVGRH